MLKMLVLSLLICVMAFERICNSWSRKFSTLNDRSTANGGVSLLSCMYVLLKLISANNTIAYNRNETILFLAECGRRRLPHSAKTSFQLALDNAIAICYTRYNR